LEKIVLYQPDRETIPMSAAFDVRTIVVFLFNV